MKQKLKLLLCTIGLLCYININAQIEAAQPVATSPQLLWENPDGTSGFQRLI